MNLSQKKVVLTGATGGLGRILIDLLRQEDATVLTLGRHETCDIRADMADARGMDAACQSIAEIAPDILINNAGLLYFGHTHTQSPENISAILRVNVEAPMLLSRAVLPSMLQKGSGQIVNIGSVLGAVPFPHFSVYSASKAALKAYSQSLRREYHHKGVRVTYIAPRAIDTAMTAGHVQGALKGNYQPVDKPEDVAAKIMSAIKTDKKEVTIGFAESLYGVMNVLNTSGVDFFVGLMGKKAEKYIDSVRD